MRPLITRFRRLCRKTGFDVIRYNWRTNSDARRNRLIDRFAIDCVVDVGANQGQYARILRRAGYRGKIISIEPTADAFRILGESARPDPRWEVMHMGLGAAAGEATIFVSANSVSSSFHQRSKRMAAVFPDSHYIATEKVAIGTLSAILGTIPTESRIWVKLDVQGSASEIVQSAGPDIASVLAWELEVAFVEMYEQEVLFPQIFTLFQQHGLDLVSLEPNTWDAATGSVLEANAIFAKSTLPAM